MGWKDLLEKDNEMVSLPWLGGNVLRGSGGRSWSLQPPLPPEHGWFSFRVTSKRAVYSGRAEPNHDVLKALPVFGYLVGNRIVPDGARVDPDPKRLAEQTDRVHLIEDGLDRFVRIQAARIDLSEPLIYISQEMPLGPEADVLQAYYDQAPSVTGLKGVTPALDAAFRMEKYQREEAERRRQELERLRREEEERRQKEERRRRLVEQLGDAQGRREMAHYDFTAAARAALAVGGAEYLDHCRAARQGEYRVTFRFMRQRFQCICDHQLRIVDAGICLINHETGERGDNRFTLESLPAVIRHAEREDRLVVFRHV